MLGGVDRAMRSTDTVTRDALSCQKVGGQGSRNRGQRVPG